MVLGYLDFFGDGWEYVFLEAGSPFQGVELENTGFGEFECCYFFVACNTIYV